jgi:hypothetical protein
VDERVVLDYLCLADGEMWNGWNVKRMLELVKPHTFRSEYQS